MQSLIRGLPQEPSDLGLHCLPLSCLADTMHKWVSLADPDKIVNTDNFDPVFVDKYLSISAESER